mmetsp:Transcript_72106/g.182314  ORF Transcript_72106/g.182314 Transcript_72106/m.182314 type:complete len:272 (-) Transcript_72106:79-894(-)
MAAAGPPAVFAFSRPAVLLLGDSITQEGSTAVGGWASALAGHFSRRADVLNRGLSGYNTRWASNVLDRCLAPHESTVLATVWYGANDAADATLNPRQHVPLDEYRKHLTNIVRRVRQRCDHVVVVSPPPIHEASYRAIFIEPRQGIGAPLDRSLEASRRYADAAGQAKVQAAAPAAEGSSDQPWGRFFYDGLHLSEEGNKLVFRELLALVGERFPDLVVEPCCHTGKRDNSGSSCAALRPHLPFHDAISLENQGTIFGDGGASCPKRQKVA